MSKNPILFGNEKIAFRDPTCIYFEGKYVLLMTVSKKRDGYMYNTVGISESYDLENWTYPKEITEENYNENFCSPGSILKQGDEYYIAVTSYPMPRPFAECDHADNTARLFFIRTKDFKTFSKPEIIMAKGDTPPELLGRMIDPYVFRDKDDEGLFHLFYKQNGVSHSHSRDLVNWVYDGFTEGGENACVIIEGGKYHLIHSPRNGIGLKTSSDLKTWEDKGESTLLQDSWEWASGRLTAAFAMKAPENVKYKYIVFFHGSRADSKPETHGSASLGIAFTNDFSEYFYN